jgi:hypothetical protein
MLADISKVCEKMALNEGQMLGPELARSKDRLQFKQPNLQTSGNE